MERNINNNENITIGTKLNTLSKNANSVYIEVNALEWNTASGEYMLNGNFKATTTFDEAESIVNSVLSDMLENLDFTADTNIMVYYMELKDNVVYHINRLYKAGRYNKTTDFLNTYKMCFAYIWEYLGMTENFDYDYEIKESI